MSKTLLILLNTLAPVACLLILADLYVSRSNADLGRQIGALQQTVNQDRAVEPILREIALRLAQGTLTDPKIKDLMKKHQLQANVIIDGKPVQIP